LFSPFEIALVLVTENSNADAHLFVRS